MNPTGAPQLTCTCRSALPFEQGSARLVEWLEERTHSTNRSTPRIRPCAGSWSTTTDTLEALVSGRRRVDSRRWTPTIRGWDARSWGAVLHMGSSRPGPGRGDPAHHRYMSVPDFTAERSSSSVQIPDSLHSSVMAPAICSALSFTHVQSVGHTLSERLRHQREHFAVQRAGAATMSPPRPCHLH